MTFDIEPLLPGLAAEIKGLDLGNPLDAETAATLRAAWLHHPVLLFRGQELSEDEQIRFASYFGTAMEPRQAKNLSRRPDRDPRVMLITNIREDGRLIGALPDGELQFHSDSAFLERPLMATVLYGVRIPGSGGNTLFASTARAYDSLSDEMKEVLAGRYGVNAFDYYTQVRIGRHDPEKSVSAIHPLIRTHPETGAKTVFVNRLMTEEIVDMAPDESAAILDELFGVIEQRAFVYAHAWRPGDLLIWDNRCTQHARTDFPADEVRLLRRVGIEGDRPY